MKLYVWECENSEIEGQVVMIIAPSIDEAAAHFEEEYPSTPLRELTGNKAPLESIRVGKEEGTRILMWR